MAGCRSRRCGVLTALFAKDRSLENLVRRNRLLHHTTMKMQALYFRTDEKPLWLGAEQQHRRVAGLAVVEQVQVGERVCGRRADDRANWRNCAVLGWRSQLPTRVAPQPSQLNTRHRLYIIP